MQLETKLLHYNHPDMIEFGEGHDTPIALVMINFKILFQVEDQNS